MKTKWIMVAVAAVALALAGAPGSAEAANPAVCAGCHGANGEGKGPNPKIAGMSEGAFTSAMNAYKSGAKKHPAMNALAKKLSDGDIAELAAYFAAK